MKYRAEIDGLRALAVVPVILFHAGFETFGGGFVGVDIFFVISGYLITTIIIEDLEKNRFRLIDFYERRSRRILPALFFVMLTFIPVSWMWMLPDPLENFGQSVVAATLSANNILLYLTAGYWDLASEFKPLLHTWSLGIEEQYYIIFPFLLFATWRYGRSRALFFIIFLAAISFVFGEWLSRESPGAAFYLIHTRAWELLAGSIVAFVVQKQGVQKNNLLSLIGLLAIFFSVFTYNKTTPIAGVYTIVPVFGAILLILYADKETFIARILGSRALVAIGLISYSAYLWHQPLLAFAKIYRKTELTLSINITLIFTTFLLSYFSWRFIEKPFRNKSKISGKIFSAAILTSAIILIGFGYSAHKSQGFLSRGFDYSVASPDLHITYNERNFEFKRAEFVANLKPKVLIIGHSFGRDIVNVIRETYDISNFDLIYRDDFDACSFARSKRGEELRTKADVIILASNYNLKKFNCIKELIAHSKQNESEIFFVGNKHFGYNLNWIARADINDRRLLRNPVMPHEIDVDQKASELIPPKNYISIMQPLTNKKGVLVTDESGRLISPDRLHLTKYGAMYIGKKVILRSPLGQALKNFRN